MRPLNSDAPSHLRRNDGDAVPTTPRLSLLDEHVLLRAYWQVADRNLVLHRWCWRLFWIAVLETGVLVGIGIAWAVNHFGF